MSGLMTNRVGALCGMLGVAGNVIGVAVLGDLPSSYRPGAMTSWVAEVLAAPDAAAVSAIAFTLGLLGLAGWALSLGSALATPAARWGGGIIAVGACVNAVGTPAPFVLGQHLGPACVARADCLPAGLALLGTTLALDALFNLVLAVGLMMIAVAARRRPGTWTWLAPLTFVAGTFSAPVSLQLFFDWAARLLAVAGPLWLVVVAVTSGLLWKGRE